MLIFATPTGFSSHELPEDLFLFIAFPVHSDAQSSPFIIPSFGRTITSMNPFILSWTRCQIENRYSKAFNIPLLFCIFLELSDQVRNLWLVSWCSFYFFLDLALNLS